MSPRETRHHDWMVVPDPYTGTTAFLSGHPKGLSTRQTDGVQQSTASQAHGTLVRHRQKASSTRVAQPFQRAWNQGGSRRAAIHSKP